VKYNCLFNLLCCWHDTYLELATMAEEGEKKEAESKKHTYPLVRVGSSDKKYICRRLRREAAAPVTDGLIYREDWG